MMNARLDAAEREFLDRNGYVVRRDVFSPAEVAAMRTACEDLVARLVQERRKRRFHVGSYTFEPNLDQAVYIKWEGDSDVVHGIEPFAHLDPAIDACAHDSRFVAPMIDFVGDEHPALFTEKLNLKRPGVGGVNPLHQDYPYWVDGKRDAARIATAMLMLDDATLENGCLQVVPGSHRSGQWKNRTDSDEFGANEIDVAAYPDAKLLPVPLAAGSMVMFGAFLVHRSDPNRSSLQRRALLFSYQPPGHPTMVEELRAEAEARRRAKAEQTASR